MSTDRPRAARRVMHSACAFSFAAAALAALITSASCGSPRAAKPYSVSSTGALVDVARIDAVVGQPLIVPLDATLSAGRVSINAELSDNRRLDTKLYRVTVELPPVRPDAEPSRWLAEPGIWSAEEVVSAERNRPGTIVAVIDIPDGADGATLALNANRIPINWLPAPGLLAPASSQAWTPIIAEPDKDLLARIEPESRSPLTRWRYRLMTDGLAQSEPPESLRFRNPVIEAIARQNESRWRAGLAALNTIDADLCERVRKRIAAVVDIGGVRVPAWPTDHAALDQLLLDILDPVAPPARRAERIEQWLREQPTAIAWVVDDGTLDEAGRNTVPAVAVANLSDRATLAWLTQTDEAASPTLTPLPSLTSTVLLNSWGNDDQAAPGSSAMVQAGAGRWSQRLSALRTPVPASPPGLNSGPFIPDLTLSTWQRGEVDRPRAEWNTVALLHRPSSSDATRSVSGRWELVIECRFVMGLGDNGREAVRIFVGPKGAPTAILRVDTGGNVRNLLPEPQAVADELAEKARSIPVTVNRDRWSFRIPLPPGSIEPDGIVRLGFTRTDSFGRGYAWPRAMLPWQEEPGRAAIDTTAWDGLNRPTE